MANEELDNAVSSLLPETESTQTTEVNNTNVETKVNETPKEVNSEPQADNSQKETKVRPSKYEVLNKNYSELRSSYDRKNQEYTSKIKELEKRLQNYAPYEEYMPELKKVLEEKRKQELLQQYQNNPLQTQQQLMEQMLNERLQPFQQQIVQQQNEQVVDKSINWMKETYGEEAFKEVSPYMANILENTKQQYGDQVADILAQNPEHLFTTAFGYLALQKIKEFNLTKQTGNQNKTQLAQQSAGISKPNRTSRTTVSQDLNTIEQQAFDYLRQNS